MKQNRRIFYLLFIAVLLVSVCILASCKDKDTCSHEYGTWKTVVHPTCTTNGTSESTCKKCGETGTKSVAAIGHKFLDYKNNNDETCTSLGTRTAQCDNYDSEAGVRCTETQTVAKTGVPKGHIYNGGKCISCAIEAYAFTDGEYDFDASATEADAVKVKVYRAADGHIEIDVFGTGNMMDFASGDEAPWAKDYKSNLVTVHVYDGVSSVGNNAFSAFTNITKVVLGKDIKRIGANAFSEKLAPKAVYIDDIASWVSLSFANTEEVPPLYMTERIYIKEEIVKDGKASYTYNLIDNVTIPETIEHINAYAFFGCDELGSIRIHPNLKSIGKYAFYGCNISEIYIYDLVAWFNINFEENGANPLTYGNGLFISNTNADGITKDTQIIDLEVPAEITVIKPYVFEGASSIISVKFNGQVTEIGRFAFANCTALTELTLCDSIEKIEEYAFAGCTGLPTLVIPNSVKVIGANAFKSTTNLASVIIGSGIETIDECVFSGATNLTHVTLGENVTEIKELAFYGCDRLIEIYNRSALLITNDNSNGCIGKNAKYVYTDGEKSRITITDDGFIFYEEGDTVYLVATNSLAGKLIFPTDFNGKSYVIADYAFSGRTHFTDVVFNSGIEKIGKDAFLNCSKVKNVKITSLEEWLKIELASEYSNPMCYAENLYIADSEIGVDSVAIPESITVIGAYAFSGATMLTDVKLHDGITEIQKNAFYRCNAMKLEKGIYTVDGWIVDVSTTVTSITIKKDTVKGISNDAFDGVKLETATMPAEYIRFINVESLKTLTVSGGVITSGALVNATSLTTINITSSVSMIEANAFDLQNCAALKTTNGVIYANNWIVGFDESYKDVYEIAYSTVGIADGAFTGVGLRSFGFSGSETKWNEIKISEEYKEIVAMIDITLNYKK